MKLSAEGGQAKPVAANATGFNPWKFTLQFTIANLLFTIANLLFTIVRLRLPRFAGNGRDETQFLILRGPLLRSGYG